MLRALFLRELRKSWLTHVGLFAAVFGTATLLEYAIEGGRENELGLSQLLLGALSLSGLVSGERCFSVAFKEGRYRFLLTLPEPRSSIWLAYLGGRLIGALAALPIVLLVRPSLLLRGLSWPESSFKVSILIALFAIYSVYFLGGAALALAVHKEILAYLIGLPIFSLLLALLAVSAYYGFDNASLLKEWLYEVSQGALILALILAIIAERAFSRGEFHLGRRSAQALTECGLASVAYAVLILVVFSSTTLSALRDEWQPIPKKDKAGANYLDSESPVSPDGRFLFIRQQLREHSSFTRIAVIDLKSGVVSSWMERPGIREAIWSSSSQLLNILTSDSSPLDCFGLPCVGSTSWLRLTPDMHMVSRRHFPGLGSLSRLNSDDLQLIIQNGRTGTVFYLSDETDKVQKIVTSTMEMEPLARPLDHGAAVVFRTGERGAWLLGGRVPRRPLGNVDRPAPASKLFDHWLFVDPKGASIWVSKTGEVWLSQLGQKPRRLNPPE